MDIATQPLIVPPKLQARVEAAAAEKQRSPSDMLDAIIEMGLRERRWRRAVSYGDERAIALGLTQADIPRLIAEVRRERRQEQSCD